MRFVERYDAIEIEYDADTGTYRTSYDGSVEPASMAIYSTVAAITGTDPCELEPLHPVVDPDALDSLFAPMEDGTPRSGGEVRFTYCGCEVTVTSDGDVRVVPTEE